MDSLWQDIRYAFRSLRRGVGLIAIAILSLALGIGANTTIFSVVDVFMFQPLPYPDANDLYAMYQTDEERGRSWTFSFPDFMDFRDRSTTNDIAAWSTASFNLADEEQPVRLVGSRVSANFFHVVGIQPVMGRAFSRDEEIVGQDRVVILGDGLWRRRFGGDPAILGRTVTLDGAAHTVVGIMPPRFWWRQPGRELWVPLSYDGKESRGSHYLGVVARLASEVTVQQASTEARRIGRQLSENFPRIGGPTGARLVPLTDDLFGEEFHLGSVVLMVAVAFVLLIACANVANLLLTRAAGREREIAVRCALGAGRLRIVRQLLTEALIVSVLGGLFGLVVATIGIKAFVAILPPQLPRMEDITMSGRVLLFTGGVTILTGLIFGMAPSLQTSNPNLTTALKEGGRGGTDSRGGKLRKVLVVSEISLAVVLLVSAVLLIQTFFKLRTAEWGFDTKDVMTFQVTLSSNEYPDTAVVQTFHTNLIDRLASIPTVRTVSAISRFPLSGNPRTPYTIAGEESAEDASRPSTGYRYVAPDYFEASDIPMLYGRDISNRDVIGAPRVAVINQRLAERHWPDTDPVGRAIELSSGSYEIVGVVGNTAELGPDVPPPPILYLSLYQTRRLGMGWVLETDGAPEKIADAVTTELATLDPNLPVFNMMSMETLLEDRTSQYTVMPKIMTFLGAVALVLAVAGVYGLMSHAVSQRTQEMGIRLALGASGMDVLSLVVRQGTILAISGVVVGIVVALGVTRSLSFFLVGVSPFDPVAFSLVAAVLLGAGVAASYFPALRATKVDPVEALRAE